MTLNTREVDQKFQIYSVIFPFLLVFLWVPTNWGFEKQKILGTSSSFGRAGRFTVGAFPVRFKQTASEDRSRWQLRWVGLALLRATRSNRWGRRFFSWTGWIFVEPGGKPVVVLGSPNIHRNGPSPKKGGRKFWSFWKSFMKDFWWYFGYFGCLLVSDWTMCFCSRWIPCRQLMIPRFGSLIEATVWRWPWTEDLGMAMEPSSQTFITFTHSCGNITFVVPGCQKLPFGKLPSVLRSRWNFTRQLQENYVKVLWWTRGWVSQTPGQGDILTLLVWCVKIAIFVDADFSQPFWGCFKQKLRVERCCA